uniref:Uncharacterized protein n=1 Tax=Bursaphelenchus xylophilus TaxID=6326 RepID=A0A1I7S7P3_BURXY
MLGLAPLYPPLGRRLGAGQPEEGPLPPAVLQPARNGLGARMEGTSTQIPMLEIRNFDSEVHGDRKFQNSPKAL